MNAFVHAIHSMQERSAVARSGRGRHPDRVTLMLFVGGVRVEKLHHLVNHAVRRLGKENVLDGVEVSTAARRTKDETNHAGRFIADFVEDLDCHRTRLVELVEHGMIKRTHCVLAGVGGRRC